MKRNSKEYAQYRHAIRRAKERVGIDLTITEIRALVKQIQSGGAEFVNKQTNRVSVFKLTLHGKETLVVYDSSRHTIVTFLTTDMARDDGTVLPDFLYFQKMENEASYAAT